MRVTWINEWHAAFLPMMHPIVQALEAAVRTGINDKDGLSRGCRHRGGNPEGGKGRAGRGEADPGQRAA
jgi:hypothetical protein